jgi:tetratricopeptide (TPR) repeat protein
MYSNWGLLEEKQKHPDEALAKYDRAVAILEPALKREPNFGRLRLSLRNANGARATLLREMGRHAEELEGWRRFVALEPPPAQPKARRHIALTLARLGEYRQALAEADAILATPGFQPDMDTFTALAATAACAAAAAGRDTNLAREERDRLVKQYGDRGVQWLTQARAAAGEAGWSKALPELSSEPLFGPLKERADFQALIHPPQGAAAPPGRGDRAAGSAQ